MSDRRQVVFYGKEGIGKFTPPRSTLAVLVGLGQKFFIVRYDNKSRLHLQAPNLTWNAVLRLAAKFAGVPRTGGRSTSTAV